MQTVSYEDWKAGALAPLPDYITVTSPIAEIPRLCRNCRFWKTDETLRILDEGNWGDCLSPDVENQLRANEGSHADFGCIHFEVKDAA